MRRRGRPPYPDLLTPREQEVLALLREGLSNDQIAQRLGVSLAGAKYHVSEILGKLGVSTREEAARWRGEERHWWLAAFAPFDGLRHRVAWLPQAALGATAVALIAGAGLLLWGLMRTDEDETSTSISGGSTVVAPTATFDFSSLPPLPTGEPYAGGPANCPGTFTTPEEALRTCVERLNDQYVYVGDCASPTPVPSDGIFDRPCSSLEATEGAYRAYQITDVASDAFDRLILEETARGWNVILRAGCAIQNQVDIDQMLQLRRAVDIAKVRADDCRFLPPPFLRPTLILGQSVPAVVRNGRTELSAARALLYPGWGIRVGVSVHNITSATLPWSADDPATIELLAEDGNATAASGVGGSLARTVPEGIPADARWYGWLMFPTEQLGNYTLRYPGQPDLILDLTPVQCLLCGISKPE